MPAFWICSGDIMLVLCLRWSLQVRNSSVKNAWAKDSNLPICDGTRSGNLDASYRFRNRSCRDDSSHIRLSEEVGRDYHHKANSRKASQHDVSQRTTQRAIRSMTTTAQRLQIIASDGTVALADALPPPQRRRDSSLKARSTLMTKTSRCKTQTNTVRHRQR